MNENSESIKIYRCNICDKKYSSQSSLCNHNKKFHTTKSIPISIPIVPVSVPVCVQNIYQCKYCNKIYANRHSKWKHQNMCKNKIDININNNNNINNINNNNNKLEKIENMLKELLEKNCKIHPKTLQKINKQLINNINTTNNINNGTIINNTFVKFGNEQLSSLLKRNDMLKIINKNCLCIEESIKSVHFNKNLPEYNNIFITNMKDTIAYIFDGTKFILTSKDEVINDLYNSHLENIEQFLEEAIIPENKYSKISKFLDSLNDGEKCFIDGCNNNKKYSNYKAYKLITIKNLIYNQSDYKILKKLNSMNLNEKIQNKLLLNENDTDE